MPQGDPFTVITEILLRLIGAVVAFTLHEWSHALLAYKLGDESQKAAGRLTINPAVHLGWQGLMLVAVFGFGWARPVRVESAHLRYGRWGMVLVSLAGCATNLILCPFILVALRACYRSFPEWVWLYDVLYSIYIISLSVGLFNLIPLPPLDGFRAISAAIALDQRQDFSRYQNIGVLVAFALMVTGMISRVITPAMDSVTRGLVSVLSALGL